jgi:hypothetical protein
MAGPGGIVNLGVGAAVAEEGITIEPVEDKNQMTIGADGSGQHSLIASEAVTVTVRVLKTSPVNALLMAMYDLQQSAPSLWGKNVITVADTNLNDLSLIQQAAFKKKPAIGYAKEAGMNEWVFDAIKGSSILGVSL